MERARLLALIETYLATLDDQWEDEWCGTERSITTEMFADFLRWLEGHESAQEATG